MIIDQQVPMMLWYTRSCTYNEGTWISAPFIHLCTPSFLSFSTCTLTHTHIFLPIVFNSCVLHSYLTPMLMSFQLQPDCDHLPRSYHRWWLSQRRAFQFMFGGGGLRVYYRWPYMNANAFYLLEDCEWYVCFLYAFGRVDWGCVCVGGGGGGVYNIWCKSSPNCYVYVNASGFYLVLALVARVCYCFFLFFVCLEFQVIRFVISTFTPIFFIEISFVLSPPPP